MLYLRFQRFNKGERGHAIVVGAIGMLAMAVAILTSVSIGNAVYQKVKLQDATDAQAYSLAVKTARTYNFLAYTNRAMVVHHCAAITFMAWLSHAYYINEVIGTLAQFASAIPFIGPVFAAVKTVIKVVFQAIKFLTPLLLLAMTGVNAALHLAQILIVNAMGAEIMAQAGATGPGGLTDSKARINELQGSLASIVSTVINFKNTAQYYGMVAGGITAPLEQFKLYGQNKLTDTTMARYRMLMSNIANAERRKYTAGAEDMSPIFLTRVWSFDLPIPFVCLTGSKRATSSIRNYENEQIKDRIDARDGLDLKLTAPCTFFSDGATLIDLHFNFGGVADLQKGGLSFGGGVKVRFVVDKTIGPIVDPGNLKWFGITGYYLANPAFTSPASSLFNQPTFAMVGTKDMKSAKQVFELKTNIVTGDGTFTKGGQGQDKGQLDLTWQGKADNAGGLGFFDNATGGMMALSAARAVYHRPGDWKEAPNFFNPLWTAQVVPADSADLKWAAAAEPAMLLFRAGVSGPTFNY